MTKDHLSLVFTGILATCALIVTGLLMRQELWSSNQESHSAVRRIAKWERFTETGNTIGPSDAPVQIIEFYDYGCPYCSRLHPVMKKIKENYKDKVSITYKHFVIEKAHPNARMAALAAECAEAQGEFPAYHDSLFASSTKLEDSPWLRIAKNVGIPDINRFHECMSEKRYVDEVDRDFREARNAGLRSIPTVIINGRVINGYNEYSKYRSIIRKILPNTN